MSEPIRTIDWSRAKPGVEYVIDGKRYALCPQCRTVVRTNKPIFGSWHICESSK